MWSSWRRVLHELCVPARAAAVRSLSLSPAQHTVIVERHWQIPLSKKGSPPRLHPRRHKIYKLVADTQSEPQEKMELILTQSVRKLGERGETVFVKKSVGRNKLLPEGLAVYPSPENKEMFAEELKRFQEGEAVEGHLQTRTGKLVVAFLKRNKLYINQMPREDFLVTKEVVCRAFLKMYDMVVPPQALTLQQETMKELGKYWCEVTVNGIDTVRVPLIIRPYRDVSAEAKRRFHAERLKQAELAKSGAVLEEETDLKTVPSESDSVDEASETSVSTAAPELTPPAPEVTPPALELTPPAPEVTPPAPEVTPPAPEATPPAPEATPPAPEATPPAPEATPPSDSPKKE